MAAGESAGAWQTEHLFGHCLIIPAETVLLGSNRDGPDFHPCK
jgi:hypothetical protein